MDRRQYLGFTGASIVALLGGCSSADDQNRERRTQTATATAIATETATATTTETPTEEPTETATSTPEPENRSFQEIYDEAMAEADAGSVDDEVLSSVDTDDWGAGDLEQVAVSAAKSVGKENAMAVGKALYENFSSNPDELYVDSRNVSLGGGVDILKVFDQKNQEIHYMMPWAHVSDEGVYLKEGENPDTSTERNLAGLEDPKNVASYVKIDPQSVRNKFEDWIQDRKEEGKETTKDMIGDSWENMINAYSDVLPGDKYGEMNITTTEAGGNEIGDREMIMPEDPSKRSLSYEGIEHIVKITEEAERRNLDEGEWLRAHYDTGWKFDVISNYDPKDGYAEAPSS